MYLQTILLITVYRDASADIETLGIGPKEASSAIPLDLRNRLIRHPVINKSKKYN